MLDATKGVVTDVGSVKAPIVEAITDPRFVGGHPMAGSELQGLDGADADLFRGAVWVLCPSTSTSDATFAVIAALVREIGGVCSRFRPIVTTSWSLSRVIFRISQQRRCFRWRARVPTIMPR